MSSFSYYTDVFEELKDKMSAIALYNEINIHNSFENINQRLRETIASFLSLYSNKVFADFTKNMRSINEQLKESLWTSYSFQLDELKIKTVINESMSDLLRAYDFAKVSENLLQGIDVHRLQMIVDNYELKTEDFGIMGELTPEEGDDVAQCLQQDLQNGDNKGFQRKAYDWTENQKKKYYLLYTIIML